MRKIVILWEYYNKTPIIQECTNLVYNINPHYEFVLDIDKCPLTKSGDESVIQLQNSVHYLRK
jgi:hypothetical protein